MDFSRGQSDRTLALLLIQLEEVEEKIDGLQRSRLELIEKILSQESFRESSDGVLLLIHQDYNHSPGVVSWRPITLFQLMV